ARRDRPRQRLEVAIEAEAPPALVAQVAAEEGLRELVEAAEERIASVAQVGRRAEQAAGVEGPDQRQAADVVLGAVAAAVEVAGLAGHARAGALVERALADAQLQRALVVTEQ